MTIIELRNLVKNCAQYAAIREEVALLIDAVLDSEPTEALIINEFGPPLAENWLLSTYTHFYFDKKNNRVFKHNGVMLRTMGQVINHVAEASN